MKGIVFDIQKFCVHDGRGIRTTVFLKGCMMRCLWCHNPESLSPKIQLSYDKSKCSSCGSCKVCPNNVHKIESNIHTVEFNKCNACGLCIDNCPNVALKLIGEEMSSEYVISEVLKDKKYYDSSGGGVTFSGGEATMQFEFLLELLKLSKENGISTALETNGIVSQEHLEKLIEYTDLFLFDYKVTNVENHKLFTNFDRDKVLDTLEILNKKNAEVVLRCPIIPTVNDNIEHFDAIKEISGKYKNITSVDIMPYHDIGRYKWEQIGLEYTLMNLKTVDKEVKQSWEEMLK